MIECEKERVEINMKKVFITTVYIMLALCSVESQDVTGVVGGKVDIKCSHILASNNIKYFCKGTCNDEDILIQTGDIENNMVKEKYSISDLRDGSFTVTIKDLETSDSGTYWCGVERYVKNTYKMVYLTVTTGSPTPPQITSISLRPPITVSRTTLSRLLPPVVSETPLTTTTTTTTKKTAAPTNKTTPEPTIGVMMYTGAALGLLICLLLLFLLIFLRQGNRAKIPADSADKRLSSNPIYSTNQLLDTHDINMDEATTTIQLQDHIYSNIVYSREATDSVNYSTVNVLRDPSSLHYSSASFSKDSHVSKHPDTDPVTYSTIKPNNAL
ncbi:hypothetical protein UPYG_G00050680 [Umbra pygmaea]|uniref:Immunoglobulin domain-containing protein n=1 Tax=Umbra pygmaea TaxID=75934 RepID=A0ABD0X707_UMBPY